MESNSNTNADKLIAFGQMALEQGWYDQAREYFEQVLALDATNREAMKGLARVYERLSRKEAVGVEAIEPVEPPLKPETLPTEHEAESLKQRFMEATKRLAEVFGMLAVAGGLLFALFFARSLLTLKGYPSEHVRLFENLSIAGLLTAFLFGALWFACYGYSATRGRR
jgi:tetratricopeptide (TPR) repeat protein